MADGAGGRVDAVVVGGGPNGLAAAVRLAQQGWSVTVLEADETVGGGARTEELTGPGYRHDVCSAILPLAVTSPFLASLPLDQHGLEWIHPEVPLAHPLDDGPAVVVERSIGRTGEHLDGDDGRSWRRVFGPLVDNWQVLREAITASMLRVPRHPFLMARFGLNALLPATTAARTRFDGPRARAVWAGMAAHSFLALESPVTSGFALGLGTTAHAVGWPLPRGGAQAVTDALAGLLRQLGGTIEVGVPVTSMAQLPRAQAYLFDLAPRQVVAIAGDRLSGRRRQQLETYPLGPGVFKIDYALSGPVPWKAEGADRAGTVHLGGTLEEVAAGEAEVARGGHAERPFMLVGQQSRFDDSRAPAGHHTLWTYCHVPNGSTVDMTGRMEAQLERFAPGFRDLVIAQHVTTPADVEARNPAMPGGDISNGRNDLWHQLARPRLSLVPYRLAQDLWLCSAATPPGGGVHGMCGYHAANAVLRAA